MESLESVIKTEVFLYEQKTYGKYEGDLIYFLSKNT